MQNKEKQSDCMCYFSRVSHIESTKQSIPIKAAAALVTAGGAELHRITSSFEKTQIGRLWSEGKQGPSETTSVGRQQERGGGRPAGSEIVQKVPRQSVISGRRENLFILVVAPVYRSYCMWGAQAN